MTQEQWVNVVFGQVDPANFHDVCAPGEPTLRRLIGVFENSAVQLGPYSDDYIAQAFWDLSSSGLQVLYRREIDWDLRHRLVRSFEPLFRDLFAARCAPVLGHLSAEGTPLNVSCYMWFDFDCWCATSDPLPKNPIDAALLQSMESILAIEHAACQESALHGLGHWHSAHPAETERIIDAFLERAGGFAGQLRDYALQARCGCVL